MSDTEALAAQFEEAKRRIAALSAEVEKEKEQRHRWEKLAEQGRPLPKDLIDLLDARDRTIVLYRREIEDQTARAEAAESSLAEARKERDEAQAGAAAMRKALEWMAPLTCQGSTCPTHTPMGEPITCPHRVAREALSSDAGKALLERLEKAEARIKELEAGQNG